MPDLFESGKLTLLESPKPGGEDMFSKGQIQADQPTGGEQDSSPQLGDGFRVYYDGLEGMDQRLTPEHRAIFQRLDAVSDNSKAARAQAINQAYIGHQLDGISHGTLERNWEAIKAQYAKENFGTVDKEIPDVKLYGLISKRMKESSAQESDQGEVKPWTWKDTMGSDIHTVKKGFENFWEGINKPLVELPEAPKDLPDLQGLGLYNPALVGGVYNALKPLVEGVESPLGLVSFGAASKLQEAGKSYPLAKKALATMGGVFTGLMGYGTAKSAIAAPDILKDPNATTEEKVRAVAAPIAEAGATLLGAVGTALELFEPKEGAAVAKEMEGKNPAQAAQILRDEAKASEIPDHAKYLEDGAAALDKISNDHDQQAAKDEAKEPVPFKEPKPTKQQGPPELVTVDQNPNLVGIKNEAVDAQLKEMGLPEATHDEKVTFKGEMEKAAEKMKADPEAGKRLVDSLDAEIRPVSGPEDALLLHEMNRLRLERDAAEREFVEASENGDQAAQMDAKLRVNQAREQFDKTSQVVTKVGTKNAQGLALRRMMIREDYSLANLERRQRVANGGKELSEDQASQIKDLHKQLTEAQAKVDAFEAQKRLAQTDPPKTVKRPPPTRRVSEFISKQADAARERIKSRLAEGRQQSGVDPTDLADHAIIGADYLAKGITKFADWSVAMVNELGESIRPYLAEIFRQSQEATDQARKLQAYKARTVTATEKLQERLDSGDLTKPVRKSLTLDPEAQKLKAEYQRVKDKIDIALRREELKNRSPLEKIGDGFLKLRKVGLISGIKTLGKVSIAGQTRIGMTIADTASGAILNKLPVIRDIAEGAPREGGTTGASAEHIAKGYVEGWMYAADQAWNVLSTGKTDAEVLEGAERGERSFINYMVNTHALAKLPAFSQEYKISLRERTAYELGKGADMTNPLNQMRVNNEAVQDGLRAKFSQDNFVTKRLNMLITSMKNTREHPTAGKIAAGITNFLFPIVKIPTNFFAESATYSNLGLGLPRAVYKTAEAVRNGLENLTPVQKDSIMRHYKKGAIGAGLMLTGYYLRNDIGGYYQPGAKDPSKPEFGGIRIFGNDIPRWMIHMPILEPLHFGATIGHVMDHLNKQGEGGSVPDAVVAGVAGLLDEIPYVSNAKNVTEFLAPGAQGKYARGELVKGSLVPRLVQDIAEMTDTDSSGRKIQRKPTTIPEHIESAIPVLRKKLPERQIKGSFRQ